MGSSAQNSSGVHWCRRRVRFNEVPEKVPKVPEKVWEALVQSQVRFNTVSEKVPKKVWEALVQSQVRFNRVREKVPEKVGETLLQSQVRFNRVPEQVPEKVSGGFCPEPGQVQQGSEKGSGDVGGFGAESSSSTWCRDCRARPESTGFRSGEGSGRLWCKARSGSTGFRRRFRRKSGRLWCRATSGSTGFRRRFR